MAARRKKKGPCCELAEVHSLLVGGNKWCWPHLVEHFKAALDPIGVESRLEYSGRLFAIILPPPTILFRKKSFTFDDAEFVLSIYMVDDLLSGRKWNGMKLWFMLKGDVDHPHVNSSGHMCMGANSAVIERFILDGDLPSAYAKAMACISSYNPNDAYHTLMPLICEICGRQVRSLYECPNCGAETCGDCSGRGCCRNCGSKCYYCGGICVKEEMETCTKCRKAICPRCKFVTKTLNTEGVCDCENGRHEEENCSRMENTYYCRRCWRDPRD